MEVRQLNHVGLHVVDVDRSVAFYGEVLGLRPIPRPDLGFPGAWFALGPGQELHLIGRDASGAGTYRECHFSVVIDDARAAARELEERGVAFRGPGERADGAWQVFLDDPDGHEIELLQPAGA